MRTTLILLAVAAAAFSMPMRAVSGLYGLNDKVELIRVSPSTGAMTPVGAPVAYEAQAQQLSTIDTKNGVFYFVGLNLTTNVDAIVGLSLETGAVVSEIPVPIVSGMLVGVGQVLDYDSATDELIMMGRESVLGTAPHHILSVSPQTGKVREITKINDVIDVLGGASGVDPAAGVEWVQLAVNKSGEVHINLMSFDIKSGAHKLSFDNTANLGTLNYDHKINQMLSIGLETSPVQRTLNRLNSLSGKVTKIGNIDGYFVINSSISALNTEGRVLYAMLQKNNQKNTDLFLVGIDADTGKIVSSVDICPVGGDCPWSLEWY